MEPIESEEERAVRDAVTIVPEALEEEFVRLPGDLAYWNAKHADAVRDHLTAKAHYETVRARAAIAIRASSEKKPTEAAIQELLDVDDAVVGSRTALIETEVAKVRLAGRCEAIRAKRDALISIGAGIRAEMQGDPSIRAGRIARAGG